MITTNKSIQQRAKDAMKSLYFIPWSKDRIEAEFVKQLTAQQAEDAQVHKAEVDLIRSIGVSHQNAANELRVKVARLFTERDALARQVEKLSKDKAKRHIIGTVLIDRSTGEVLDTPPDATPSAMKGKTHE